MRTNQASLALSIGMGLIVLLIGFLALSAAGLVQVTADSLVVEQAVPATGCGTEALVSQPEISYAPVSGTELASLVWRTPAQGGDAVALASGDALFKNNCAQCHAVNDRLVGPALAGITKRRRIAWVVSWVRNSSKVIASGDEYAVKLFNDYDKQQMPAFPELKEKDIKDIILWVGMQQNFSTATVSAVAAN